jgi:transforming growth factor-beta-induced protein
MVFYHPQHFTGVYNMRKVLGVLLVLGLLVVAALPAFAQDEPGTIVDVAVAASQADAPEFTVLVAAVLAADPAIAETLTSEGPFTVFAPTDEAFGELLEALELTAEELLADTELLTTVLQYHVVEGAFMAEDVLAIEGIEEGVSVPSLLEGDSLKLMVADGSVYVDDAMVIATDIIASNGVIHVIDSVLIPDGDLVTIAEIVVASAGAEEAEFTTLLAAVLAADPAVLEALSDPDASLTVFAPTDAAFAALVEALGEDAFSGILADQEALTNILLYHVVDGVFMAEDVLGLEGIEDGVEVPSLFADGSLILKTEMGNVYVNASQVIAADVEASNGVIHVIDAVLVPASE